MRKFRSLLLPAALACLPIAVEAREICTLVIDAASGKNVLRKGACDTRMAPASTFKAVISLMGFDAGVLASPTAPELPFHTGYADWQPEWRQHIGPTKWMQLSVVWYSQQITQRLGAERFRAYVEAFDYGNRDVSGDPGMDNGLTRAWLSSSLQISPTEQVDFLRRMLRDQLPVKPDAVSYTAVIMDQGFKGDWHVFGKTGTGMPRDDKGALIRSQAFGWYIGWAELGERRVIFARLIQDEARQTEPAGLRAREGLMHDLFGPKGALN